MKMKQLGHSSIEVSSIGLGCMGMDHAYGKPADRQEMINLIRHAVNIGCNFFDTAPIYGEGNEEVLGEALKDCRKNAVIATKFGIVGQTVKDGKPANVLNSKPESIAQQLEASLKRLQSSYIDLYYQHRIDPTVEPEVVAETMKELIAEGKIKAWGVCEAPIEYIKRAHKICPISAIENQYSMMWRQPEEKLFPLCEELGITFVAYSPLGNGFLSGAYTKGMAYDKADFRGFMGRFKPDVMDHNQALLDLIAEYAKKKNASSAQIVLAWELAQKPYIIPIPGTTKIHRLQENVDSMKIVLAQEEIEALNSALCKIKIDETHF